MDKIDWRNTVLKKEGKAVSKDQQRFMAMVHAYQKGKLNTRKMTPQQKARIKRVALNISKKDAQEFVETKHRGLPEKVAALVSNPELEASINEAFIKYAINKCGTTTYEAYLRTVPVKERIRRGAISSGVPSAILTGALGLATGVKYKPALKAAVGVGLLATTIGTLITPKKKRVFVPLADNRYGYYR